MSLENVVSGARELRRGGMPKTVFEFDPRSYQDEFSGKGYVHIKNGVSREFIEMARERVAEYQSDRSQFLSEWEFKNKKQQYLFEFPDDNKLLRGAMDMVASVTGMPRDMVTVSERHVKVYAPNAHPNPPAHKDRFASKVAVGIPLFMPSESDVVLYPDQSREINRFDSTEDWRNSFSATEVPEVVLKNVEPVKLHVGVGDVIMFHGSAIYHERINGANAVLLYLKFSDARLDPLGEDPFMQEQRQTSLSILAKKRSDEDLLDSTIEVSPRLFRISRHYTRYDWREVLQGQVAGDKPFLMSEADLVLIQRVEGRGTVRQLLARIGTSEAEMSGTVRRLRHLGERGGIDFLS